jgi:hypothetical protein
MLKTNFKIPLAPPDFYVEKDKKDDVCLMHL